MTKVRIAVRGFHSVRVRPEQATVHAAVAAEGGSADPVFARVAAALAEVSDSLQTRHHAKRGPVTRFAVDQIRRGAHRPFNTEGKQLPVVHTAQVSVTATFTDFDDLAAWVRWGSGVDGLGIQYIDWALTDRSRLRVERKTRQKAVRDAKRRAQDYADALDLGPVTVCSVSDPGMRDPGEASYRLASASMAAPPEPAAFELRPDEVEISAAVEAVFTVGGR